MNDYSDILFLLGSMLIFSTLVMQVNRIFLYNDRTTVNNEVEYHAITMAEEYADQVRWMGTVADLEAFAAEYSPQTDFYMIGGEDIPFDIHIDEQDITIPGASVALTNKLVTIEMQSPFLEPRQVNDPENFRRSVTVQLIRTFN